MEVKETKKLLPRSKFSLDITLPAWWLKGHNLHKGSQVRVTATENCVIIEPPESKGDEH